MSTVSVIFILEPTQWGLRGAPLLRSLLKEKYQKVELPYPPQAFRKDILYLFSDLTGRTPILGKTYYVKKFAKQHVGMSTDWLSGDFWQCEAIPLLIKRLKQANLCFKKEV